MMRCNSFFVLLLALVFPNGPAGCANIEFERGPYAVQEVDIVYSIQEDVTFMVWRLRQDADLSRVRFEVSEEGDWLPLDLNDALFASAPFKCGTSWCFQYQWAGKKTWAESAIRSVHIDDGYFAADPRRTRTLIATLSIAPIGLDDNRRIDPNLNDVLANEFLPTRRNFRWELVGNADECQGGVFAGGELQPLAELADLSWTQEDLCMGVWPTRADGVRTLVSAPIVPSAQTFWEVQRYIPPVEESPIVYGVLFDLEIPNESRCSDVQDGILSALNSAFTGRGEVELLDVYRPLDTQSGEELSGCEQRPQQDYPVAKMLQDARLKTRQLAPVDVRVLWIYINNVNVAPSERIVGQIGQLFVEGLSFETFTWSIGTNPVLQIGLWDVTTGWRAIEDETLLRDIRAVARANLPFKTMRHTMETRVTIQAPDSPRIQGVKRCAATPFPVDAFGVENPLRFYDSSRHAFVPWSDEPVFYYVEIEPQFLVPNTAYVRHELIVTFEFCTEFCANPFRTQGGVDISSWSAPESFPQMEVCQWVP